jgi:hypothetical protein
MSHREPHAATEPHTGAVMGMRGCESAAECRSDRPGHGLHVMQERLAATTASRRSPKSGATPCAACGTTTHSTVHSPSANRSRCTLSMASWRAVPSGSASPTPERVATVSTREPAVGTQPPATGISLLIEPIIFSIAMTA